MWVCVHRIQRIGPSAAARIACMCDSSSGPGSMTINSCVPMRYVFVPGPVITPPLGAMIRVTAASSSCGTPGTNSYESFKIGYPFEDETTHPACGHRPAGACGHGRRIRNDAARGGGPHHSTRSQHHLQIEGAGSSL